MDWTAISGTAWFSGSEPETERNRRFLPLLSDTPRLSNRRLALTQADTYFVPLRGGPVVLSIFGGDEQLLKSLPVNENLYLHGPLSKISLSFQIASAEDLKVQLFNPVEADSSVDACSLAADSN
uniref:Uncharacterized protein n=1 Tax=Rhodosorus marinus TaxID=101924 RepID=A0A7S3A356_9RHOD|mmetsp:Transcript_41368/g.162975  ORF Transcript_41368/g.162975 Transcript_41368/m.162975 type:complete len:124 (+) Transcript_41368:889-1260(+)